MTCKHILLPVDTQKNNLLSQLPRDYNGDKLVKMEIEKVFFVFQDTGDCVSL